jgi:Arc/MetJ-type ribon-helix-helix transcriptional regulator
MNPKKYEVRLTVNVPKELAVFLDEMIKKGIAENTSQAIRKCIYTAKQYIPVVEIKAVEEEKKEEEKKEEEKKD